MITFLSPPHFPSLPPLPSIHPSCCFFVLPISSLWISMDLSSLLFSSSLLLYSPPLLFFSFPNLLSSLLLSSFPLLSLFPLLSASLSSSSFPPLFPHHSPRLLSSFLSSPLSSSSFISFPLISSPLLSFPHFLSFSLFPVLVTSPLLSSPLFSSCLLSSLPASCFPQCFFIFLLFSVLPISFPLFSSPLLSSQCLFDSWLTQKEELVRSIKTSNLKDQAEMVACLRRLAVSLPATDPLSLHKVLHKNPRH